MLPKGLGSKVVDGILCLHFLTLFVAYINFLIQVFIVMTKYHVGNTHNICFVLLLGVKLFAIFSYGPVSVNSKYIGNNNFELCVENQYTFEASAAVVQI